MPLFTLRLFNQKIKQHKIAFKRFLNKLEKNAPKGLDKLAEQINAEVWQEVDCLTCANCCKKMSPTFTTADMKRISAYLQITVDEFKDKWLYLEKKENDWMNRKQPCQFLDLKTNMCSIYEVRPIDCAKFPHLTKKKMVDYIHVHVQNINYCPATYKMVEKMKERIKV